MNSPLKASRAAVELTSVGLVREQRVHQPAGRRISCVIPCFNDGGAEAYRHRLQQWIANCRSGDVLLCHPSLGDVAAVPHDAARRNEYAVLRTLAFPMETDAGRILLRPFSRQPPVESEARA